MPLDALSRCEPPGTGKAGPAVCSTRDAPRLTGAAAGLRRWPLGLGSSCGWWFVGCWRCVGVTGWAAWPTAPFSARRLWRDLQAFCCSQGKCNFHDNSNLNCTLKVRGTTAPTRAQRRCP